MKKILVNGYELIKDESRKNVYIYIDFFDKYSKVLDLDFDYDDIYALATYGVVDIWFNFNEGDIEMEKGLLKISISTDTEHIEEKEDRIAIEKMIEKYNLKDTFKTFYVELIANIQGDKVYTCENILS